MNKAICIVSEEEEQTIIKKIIPLTKLKEVNEIDDNFRLEYRFYDTDNQIWYELSVKKI
jgi:hypothetical protein